MFIQSRVDCGRWKISNLRRFDGATDRPLALRPSHGLAIETEPWSRIAELHWVSASRACICERNRERERAQMREHSDALSLCSCSPVACVTTLFFLSRSLMLFIGFQVLHLSTGLRRFKFLGKFIFLYLFGFVVADAVVVVPYSQVWRSQFRSLIAASALSSAPAYRFYLSSAVCVYVYLY